MEIGTILLAVFACLVSYLFYKYFIEIYDYWPKRGVPCVNGPLPFFGNTLSIFLLRKDFPTYASEVYNNYPNSSIVGFYQNRKPNLLIRDPEVLKTVLVSAFSNFHKNVLSVDPELDPLLAQNPFFVSGEEWKQRRSYLSNSLMSSKKLKSLCAIVSKVTIKFQKYLQENIKKSNGVYEIESKELFTRFTGEVVANVGFGVEGEFFKNDKNPNSFREMVKGIFDGTFSSVIIFTLIFIFPALNKIFRVSFLSKKLDRYFRQVTSQIIAERENNDSVPDDFLQMLLTVHPRKNDDIDIDGITASATSFFIDGYETSAITLAFFAYHVAIDPDVQDKIRREVNDVLEKHNGEISYDALGAMIYMDQALNESMRIQPAFGALIKCCNDNYKLIGSDGIEVLVETGTEIIIPVESVQKDPKYWKDPETYDPERFHPQRKNDRPKTIFLPFGDGPRACVGMRFATMQIKAAMATIMKCCRIELSSKTKLPLEFTQTPLKTVIGGLWLKFERL